MNPFDPYSNPHSELFGREDDVEEILSLVNGVNHVSVVAPKLYGKRALLREVARRAKEGGEFDAVVTWDMKASLAKAETFFPDLAQLIWDQWADAKQHFTHGVTDMTGEALIRKSKDWQCMGSRLLLVWMSFDEVLRSPELPDNFLDQLRNLCAGQGVRIVASTRYEMSELVVNQSDIGSTLWGQFRVHPLGTFSRDDWASLKGECEKQGVSFDPGAEDAIIEHAGYSPPILLALCSLLAGRKAEARFISKTDVSRAAENLDTRVLKETWKELSTDSQELMQKVARSKDGIPANGIPDRVFEPLTKRYGLLRKSSGRFLSSSCLFAEFAARQESSSGHLAVLFGTADNYSSNMAEVLRLRLGQVKIPMSLELRKSVETMLDNMEECSSVALDTVRRVFQGAATLLMKRKFPSDRIPPQMIDEWKNGGFFPECGRDGKVPRTRGHLLQLLRKLHETLKLQPQQSWPLFDLLYQAGNLAQHDDEHDPVSRPFAITVASAAVELLVLLDQTNNE